MYSKILRVSAYHVEPDTTLDNDEILQPCECLGTRIANQMYNGVDQGNSTLFSGQYDDPDCWDVDPACDMSTDRMDMTFSDRIPDNDPSPSTSTVE